MKTTIDKGDIITTETIADKIRRIAKHPQVVKNRRLLKAMYYITQRENATMTYTKWETNVNGGSKHVTAVVATCDIINNGRFAQQIGKTIVMFPLNSYDPHTGEPPTIRE
jgi:hypothetical protein